MHRPVETLYGLSAEVHEAEAYRVRDVLVHVLRDADIACACQRLHARRHIHAIAVEVVPIDDHVA
jgi:hypothetical protein